MQAISQDGRKADIGQTFTMQVNRKPHPGEKVEINYKCYRLNVAVVLDVTRNKQGKKYTVTCGMLT